MTHQFKIGDYLRDYGSITGVTEKAICVSINNGKWVGNRDNCKWIPKSALIVHQAINEKGLLNDDTKHLIIADFKDWFRL
jgi:hypothetical protein